MSIYEPVHEIKVYLLIALVNNEESDESAHMRRLVWAFAAHIHKVWMKMNAQI